MNIRETIFERDIFAIRKMMIYDLKDMDTAAAAILKKAENKRIFAFTTEMGTGKTTLITALCRQLKVMERPSSPSFSIINEYTTPSGEPVYHLDLYRVKNLEEAIQAGVLEVIDGTYYCFLEWPGFILPYLPGNTVYISLQFISETARQIEFSDSPAGTDKKP
jgi:tRNA threonylcarbamoyladenosine biosynthesis protein TsaE